MKVKGLKIPHNPRMKTRIMEMNMKMMKIMKMRRKMAKTKMKMKMNYLKSHQNPFMRRNRKKNLQYLKLKNFGQNSKVKRLKTLQLPEIHKNLLLKVFASN